MKHSSLILAISAFCLAGHADAQTADVAPANGRVLTGVSNFGDFMGESRPDKLTAKHLYFYNADLQVVAVVETAADLNKTELYTQYYNPYIYDANGNHISINRYQYGLYDFGDRAMHEAAGGVSYEYDAQGRCVAMIEGDKTEQYSYDAEGHMVKAVHLNGGKLSKTLTYSNFAAGIDKPGTVVSEHVNQTFTGEFYEETREYDAQGRMVRAHRICNRDYEEKVSSFYSISTSYGDFMQEERWTYAADGLLSLYEKFTHMNEETGELEPYLKTVYTPKSANTVSLQSYTAFSGEWYKSGVLQENEYVDFAGMTQPTALTLVGVQKAPTGVNTAVVEFTKPAIASQRTDVAFAIYRNGELKATVPLSQTVTNAAGNLTYTDADVPSGRYEYFVQTIVGGTGYCASGIVAIDLAVQLPAATRVYASACEKTKENLNYVTVQFTAPQIAPELGFISHELIVGNNQVGEEITSDPAASQLHFTTGETTATVFILTRYKYGKALSAKFTVDVNNLTEPEEPETPGQPSEPDTPDTPDQPDQPGIPDQPGTPDQPALPNAPIVLMSPADHQVLSMSLNGKWATGVYVDNAYGKRGFLWNLESDEIVELSTEEESEGWTVANDGTVCGSFTDHTRYENGAGTLMPGYYKDGQWHTVECPAGFSGPADNYHGGGQGFAISEDGSIMTGSLYVNDTWQPAVWNIAEGGKLLQLLEVSNNGMQGGSPYCISPDGQTIGGWSYRYNRSTTLWTLGEKTRRFLSESETPFSSVNRFSPDGRKVLYGGGWDNSIHEDAETQYYYSILDIETGETISLPAYNSSSTVSLFGISNSNTCVGATHDFDGGRAIIYKNGQGPAILLDEYLAEQGVDFDALGIPVNADYGYRLIWRGQDISADDNIIMLVAYDGNGYMRSIAVMLNQDAQHASPISLATRQLSGLPTIEVAWKAPVRSTEGLQAYRVYRDGTLLAEVPASVTAYYDTQLPLNVAYSYTVASVYADGTEMNAQTPAITPREQQVATPQNLMARQKGIYSVYAAWETPGSNLITKSWYNPARANLRPFGINLDNETIELGIGFDHAEMANYADYAIRKVAFYPMGEQQGWTVNIYKYDQEGTLVPVYSQPITQELRYKERNTVVLNEPVAVPTDGDLVVAIQATVPVASQNVIGMDNGNNTAGYSDLLRRSSEPDFYSYNHVTTAQGVPTYASFMIEAILAPAQQDLGADDVVDYLVTLDKNEPVAVTGNEWTSGKVASAGDHTLTVQARFADGSVSNAVSKSVRVAYNYKPVTDVQIQTEGSKASFTWQAPVDDDAKVITYANGKANTSGDAGIVGPAETNYSFMAAAEYSGSVLRGYDGYAIRSLRFYPTANATFTFFIFEDGIQIAEVWVDDYELNAWNEVEVEEPVILNAANTYIVALECYDVDTEKAPLAIDDKLGITFVSDLISQDGGMSWSNITNESGYMGNWMLGMTIADPQAQPCAMQGYDVRIDNVTRNTDGKLTDTHFEYDLGADSNGAHTVRINSYYVGRATVVNGSRLDFEISGAAGISDIQLDADQSVVVFAADGSRVAAGKADVLSSLPAGVYMVQVIGGPSYKVAVE